MKYNNRNNSNNNNNKHIIQFKHAFKFHCTFTSTSTSLLALRKQLLQDETRFPTTATVLGSDDLIDVAVGAPAPLIAELGGIGSGDAAGDLVADDGEELEPVPAAARR